MHTIWSKTVCPEYAGRHRIFSAVKQLYTQCHVSRADRSGTGLGLSSLRTMANRYTVMAGSCNQNTLSLHGPPHPSPIYHLHYNTHSSQSSFLEVAQTKSQGCRLGDKRGFCTHNTLQTRHRGTCEHVPDPVPIIEIACSSQGILHCHHIPIVQPEPHQPFNCPESSNHLLCWADDDVIYFHVVWSRQTP